LSFLHYPAPKLICESLAPFASPFSISLEAPLSVFFSLFLTLFVVPAVYIFVSGKHVKAVEEIA
jgi:hypothetical protein